VAEDSERAEKALAKLNEAVKDYTHYLDAYTDTLRPDMRRVAKQLRDEVDIKITSCEVHIIRLAGVISTDAEYHIASAYFHASPGLWAIIVGILEVIKAVIEWIKIVNDLLVAITDENLVYWLNKLIPGFENAWNSVLHGISNLSQKLGWGVDGISHLLNAFNIGTDTWGAIMGKSDIGIRSEKMERTQAFLSSLSNRLEEWENVPGIMFNDVLNSISSSKNYQSRLRMDGIKLRLDQAWDRAWQTLNNVSSLTHELGALREDMPAFIANHIPQGIWDGIDRVQRTIDEGILPVMTDIGDRIDAVNAVLEAHRIKAEALAESLNNPGDLLERINNLSDSAKAAQLEKIDNIASLKLQQENEAEFAVLGPEFAELESIADALSQAPPPLPFMTLEFPGRSPGIVAEPRETWFVGNY